MSALSRQELQDLVFAHGRRIAALEAEMAKVAPGFDPLHAIAPPAASLLEKAPAPATEAKAPEELTLSEYMQRRRRERPVYTAEVTVEIPPAVAAVATPSGEIAAEAPMPPPDLIASAAPSAMPFLTAEEFAGRKRERTPRPLPEPKRELGLEELLGTKWLLRIGGVLLLIGLAYGAIKFQVFSMMTPLMSVIGGYLLSAAIGAAGMWVGKRNELVGRTTVAIALAAAYFVSFASHFIPRTQVWASPWPVLPLMVGFAAVIVVLAERWRAEIVAIFGVALAMIAALVSAPASEHFALIAMGVLAVASGVLLLRNEWIHLSGLTLFGTYGSLAGLWFYLFILRSGGALVADGSLVLTHLAAVLAYHAVFLAAFWKWSRPWMAREEAHARLAEDDPSVPSFALGKLPYATGFAVLNTMGLVGLSVGLLWITQVYWPKVHLVLFGLAALEAVRLISPTLRRGVLQGFHGMTAVVLLTAAVYTAFDGAERSVFLALQAVLLAVAGSRARGMEWLRPTALLPALAAVPGLLNSPNLFSSLLLLASTVPFHRGWREKRFAEDAQILGTAEFVSASLRALFAVAMTGVAILNMPATSPQTAAICALALLLVVGMRILRQSAWLAAAMCAQAAALIAVGIQAVDENEGIVVSLVLTFASIYSWDAMSFGRWKNRALLFAPIFAIFGLLFGGIAVSVAWDRVPMGGVFGMLLAAACYSIYRLAKWEAGDAPRWFGSLSAWSLITAAIATTWVTLADDIQTSPWSSILLVVIGIALWCISASARRHWAATAAAAYVLLVVTVAAATFLGYSTGLFPLLFAVGALLFGGGFVMRTAGTKVLSFSYLLLVMASAGVGILDGKVSWQGDALPVLLTGLAGLALSAVMKRGVVDDADPFSAAAEEMPWHRLTGYVSAALCLVALARLEYLEGAYLTVSWGVLAIMLLVAGFALRKEHFRHVAIGIFFLSIGRIVFYDLAHSSDFARVAGFIGIGLLMIGAGLLYGVLSRRLLKEE